MTGEVAARPATRSRVSDWRAMMEHIDRLAADAARRDLAGRSVTMDDLARGFSELAKLRGGGEPDYALPGVGTAYLVYYLARRTANAIVACESLEAMPAAVDVLDIGAGTNAAALALSLLFPETQFTLTALEPSREMAAAGAAATVALPNVTIWHVAATLEALQDGAVLPEATFDLVIMSAMLPYGWRIPAPHGRIEFGERFARRVRPGGRVVVVEPRAKVDELEVLARCLERTGLDYTISESPGFPAGARMPALDALGEEWLAAILASPDCSPAAARMLEANARFGNRVEVVSPDLLLVGVRPIRAATLAGTGPPLGRLPRLSGPAAAPSGRTQVTTATPMRHWLAWTAAAVAAVAAIAAVVVLQAG